MADMEAIKAALAKVEALVAQADSSAMASKRQPPVPAGGDMKDGSGEEDCPDCAAGDCMEHPKEDDISALEAALSGSK